MRRTALWQIATIALGLLFAAPALRAQTGDTWQRPAAGPIVQQLFLPASGDVRALHLVLRPDANPVAAEWQRPAAGPIAQQLFLPGDFRALRLTLHPQGTPPPPAPPPPVIAFGASTERVLRVSAAAPPVKSQATVATDPSVLAPIATANFPAPQPLSVTLVPPASPLAALASANFPAPQPLSVVLVPPPSLYAAIASANFPKPQPLSVALAPGATQATTTLVAGPAPPSFTVADVSVQVVQVIPRSGVNFFDFRDPTGPDTVLAAQPGGGGGGSSAGPGPCAPGASSGGTFQSVTASVSFECHSLAVTSGSGDVLAMGDFHIDFNPPGANLVARININSGPTFAILTGANKSTFSLTGLTTAPHGTVPAGTPMRINGTVTTVPFPKFNNFTLTVCPASGPVVYRRPAGDCS